MEIAQRALAEDRALNWPWEQLKRDACRYHDHRHDDDDYICETAVDEIRGPGW
jgi:hypothetical protein